MAGADGNAVLVKMPCDTFIRHPGNYKGYDTRLGCRRADGAQTGNRRQRLRRVFQQRVFIGGNAGNADFEQ